MTELSRGKNRAIQYLAIRMILCLIVGGQIGEINAKGLAMRTNEMTLWNVVDALAMQVPFAREKVELLLSTKLRQVDQNPYTVFYVGGDVPLANDVLISAIDLRLGRELGDNYGFMSIGLTGKCVLIDDVRVQYGLLEITETPRGRSPDEKTYHTVKQAWGELSFGFSERNPDCLSVIVFDPKK